jgi:phosphoribosylaminoimidazolecarboxamide formyltransferase / IMP cyclohydrolase
MEYGVRQRVMLSVTDKTGITKWGQLSPTKWELISTGGTAKTLQDGGVAVTPVEVITGVPEMMSGRIKTLNHKLYGGILADRDDESHMKALAALEMTPISVVVINLYEFEKQKCIDQIDIGGPSGLRAAAKNGKHVAVVVDPADYDTVIEHLLKTGTVPMELRELLFYKVFAATAKYDTAIATWAAECLLLKQPLFIRSTQSH